MRCFRQHSADAPLELCQETSDPATSLTDVAGGPSPSILNVIRAAMDVSIHVSFSKKNYKPLNYQEAFYLATLGGAKGKVYFLTYFT